VRAPTSAVACSTVATTAEAHAVEQERIIAQALTEQASYGSAMRVTRAYVPAIFVLSTAGLASLAVGAVLEMASPGGGWPVILVGLVLVGTAMAFASTGTLSLGIRGSFAPKERLVWLVGSAIFVAGLLAAMRFGGSSGAWYGVAFAGTYVQVVAQLMVLDRAGAS
jgi:hypothetical protein